jgi:mono/diheme cytochrome c family protein
VAFPRIYITPKDSSYAYHYFPFQFGATELARLKIFLKAALAGMGTYQHAGNCASCHTAPDFADFGFHHTGVSQNDYAAAHQLMWAFASSVARRRFDPIV